MEAEPIRPARIGPWAAIGLLIVVFAILEVVLPMARAALAPHLPSATPRDIVAVRAVSSMVLVWILFGAAYVLLRLRGQNLQSIGWNVSSTWFQRRVGLAHLTATPWVSLMYWDPRHQQVAIEARATICDDAASLAAAWAAFSAPPEPYGYDPSPIWPDGPDVGFVAVRLDPVRVSMFGAPPRTWTSPELTRP